MLADYILWGTSGCVLLYVYFLIAAEVGPMVVAADQHMHSKIRSAFPGLLNTVDRISQFLLDVITDNKFGYLLTLGLLVLTLAGTVSVTVTVAAALIWWIVIVWALRSKLLSGFTIPTRTVVLLCIAAILAFGCLKFRNWSLRQYVASLTTTGATTEAENKPALSISFRTEYIDMSRRLDDSPYWVLYDSTFGDTVSPVALLAFFDITNASAKPINVASYVMSIKTESCGWSFLAPISTTGMRYLMWGPGKTGLTGARVIDMQDPLFPSFNYLWERAISPHAIQHGFLLFDTYQECSTPPGTPIELKLEVKDSAGTTYPPFELSSVIRPTNPVPATSIGQAIVASIHLTGYVVDAGACHRKHFSEANIIKPGDAIATSTAARLSGSFTLKFPDGAFSFPKAP